MAIKRINLVYAINIANKEEDYETYKELLTLYYKLLAQENINDKFIAEFVTYDSISDTALKLIENN